MEFLERIAGIVLAWVRPLWPGVLGAMGLGYAGVQRLGFVGLLIGAALGALLGTWLGQKLRLIKVRPIMGDPSQDRLIHAAGAFGIVVCGYTLFQAAMVIATLIAIAFLFIVWLGS